MRRRRDGTALRRPLVEAAVQDRRVVEADRAQHPPYPGSAFIDLQEELSDKHAKTNFMMLPVEELARRFAAKGIGEDTRVVLYSRKAIQWATRASGILLRAGSCRRDHRGSPILLPTVIESSHIDKAAAHCAANKIEESALLQDRLYPDMFCLARQIRQSADFAMNTGGRLAAGTGRPYRVQSGRADFDAGHIRRYSPTMPAVDDTSFAAAKSRVETALGFVKSLTRTRGGQGHQQRRITFCVIAACRSARGTSSGRSTGSSVMTRIIFAAGVDVGGPSFDYESTLVAAVRGGPICTTEAHAHVSPAQPLNSVHGVAHRGARFRPRRWRCRGPVPSTEIPFILHRGLLTQSLRSQRLPRQSGYCRPCFVPTGLSLAVRCRTRSRARDRPRQCRRSGTSGCVHPGV